MHRTIIDNRYRILKKLGSGAMGEVYKVRDLKDKRIIALKILKKKMASSEAVQRFKREFKLLTELHHPNLCAVYDFGVLKDGRSYFTMEYIDGPNIFEFTKNPVRKNISNGVYPLIVQLCRVLEYIHAKGLIHYDVKSGNVLIQKTGDDACVKLMDFGLAGEQRVRDGTIIKGTFPYIAPEVIKGLEVDHRADLYSLGLLLYEIFTKRSLRAEGKESFATILEQRRKWFLELPSEIVTDIPKNLERIIVRLCSLQPAARFSRANEVIREINNIAGLKFELETEKTLEGYILSSQFVGRDKEMDILKSLHEKAKQGEGKVVLITGDAGIGKSRLLKELRIFTQLKRSHTFIGYAHKDKIVPLEPFYDVFSELINYVGNGSDLLRSRELKLSLAVLFRIFPDLVDGRVKKYMLPKLVPLGPKQEKLRTFDALSELIRHTASELSELVILLEDLHWADDLSIEFLEYLGRNLGGRNILICGTSRKQELEENLVFKRVIINLKKENYFTQIGLRPLKFKSLYLFLDSMITPGSNSSQLVIDLMKKTGGNPFFVEEIMRTLLQKKGMGIGGRMDMAHLQKISIPKTIEHVVLKRLKDLDTTSLEVVKFGAILLKDFGYDLMKKLTGLKDIELSKALWKLKRRQVLIEEGNKYQFYHTTLREAISKRMAYREKRKLYYQTGRILELIYKKNIEGVVEDLAYYFINAKDRKKGVTYGLRAAQKSSERYANEQAIQFYKGVLGLLGDKEPKRRFDILRELAKIEDIINCYDDMIKHYNTALSLKTGTIDKRIKIYLEIGCLYEKMAKFNKALHIYQRATKLLKKMKSDRLKTLFKIYVNVRICRAHLMIGNFKSASKFKLDTLQFPKTGLKGKKTIELLAHIYNTMGVIESHTGGYSQANSDKAIFYYKEAYKCNKKIKDKVGIAASLNNLGIVYRRKFENQKALNCYQKAIQISEKIGEQHGVLIALLNLGNILKDKGRYSKALDCYQKALSISERINDPFTTGGSLALLERCFFQLCNYNKSKELSEKALRIFTSIGWNDGRSDSIKAIGEINQAKGNYSIALGLYRKALKIPKDIGDQQDIAFLFIDIGLVFIEIGGFSKAKRYIEDALKIASMIDSKKAKIDCYIVLCRINIMTKNYIVANDYYKKGIRMAERLGTKLQLLQLFILASEIYYAEKKYRKGIKVANKAIKMAKEMGTKDLYAESLLLKVKNGIKLHVLSKLEVRKMLDEAKTIAEEISCPEVLWKVYYEYGRFLQKNREYRKALQYHGQYVGVFRNVVSKLKNASYKKSYLNRPDRQAAIQQPSLLLPEFENYLKRA